jgi:hypothetical protein
VVHFGHPGAFEEGQPAPVIDKAVDRCGYFQPAVATARARFWLERATARRATAAGAVIMPTPHVWRSVTFLAPFSFICRVAEWKHNCFHLED